MEHEETLTEAPPLPKAASSNLAGRTFSEETERECSKSEANGHFTRSGKPAKSKYRKLNLGEERRDEHRVNMERIVGRRLGRNEVVHHRNGDTYDNRLENLEILTRSEHTRLHNLGERCPTSILKEWQVREIMASTLSHRKLAEIYGVKKSVVSDIKSRRTWAHLWPATTTEASKSP